jgi:hypothetical protein
MTTEEITRRLTHAVTEYDRKESSKKHYNRFALGQYFERIADIRADLDRGAEVRAAIVAGFTGRLLDVCLKSVGESTSVDAEQRGGWFYQPAK